MIKKIATGIFSITGLSITIGALGGVSALVTLFININTQLSIKWFLAILLISISLIFILLKLIYDINNEVKPQPTFETPTHAYPEEKIFIIKKNDNFINNIMLGCYYRNEEREQLAYVGQIDNIDIQSKIIQIKILFDCQVLDYIPDTPQELKNIIVRSVVPASIFYKLKELNND